MSVDVTSRYWALPSHEIPSADGPKFVLPGRPTPAQPTGQIVNHRMTGVENIEYLAWRYYGRSAAWWMVMDANSLVFPLDFAPGDTVKLPPAGDVGRIARTRSF